jgi:carboxymethylenebutenolidase
MSEDRLREAIALYDRFTHEGMDRRVFMARLSRIAGGAAAASMLLSSIAASAQSVPQVAADDPRLTTETFPFNSDGVTLSCYRAELTAPAERPAVVVIHENRGLNAHIRDVTRRVALAGFEAIAPDFLSMDGGATPASEDEARAAIGALDPMRVTRAGAILIGMLHFNGGPVRPRRPARRVGAVGFCWGGGLVNRLAVACGDALAAAAPFYGPAPNPSEAAQVRAAMLIVLAGLDQRVNATARPWAEALRAAGKTVEVREFPNVDHAFHNDTSAARYNREAAEQAWTATLSFFRQHLEGRRAVH